ncbi:glycosyltransferase family 4 protein [Spirosoma foliorum]|uniref:Glycosyltransferase family 4 protein n=1 Tax=Spirosoma foliorum TaxID=2710596 RepID=A0A7G5H2C3_9BACT|nr:glycosyltransferase family 4 protein [Spirosoma foliorum]QMW05265.1 glycosyltransferase family 4 protein [Spirosoma foliorum]
MRVLLIHNFYQQAGGEDTVFYQETNLLRENGVEVETLTFTNETFEGSLLNKLGSVTRSLYNTKSAARTEAVIDWFKPDVVHIHNLFYTATAAVIRVAKVRGVPVVMTVHNYRLLCLNGLLMREGKVPCETCLTQMVPLAGIRHGCFRDSHLQSAQLSLITTLHKLTGIWRSVDRFVVLTEFVRQKILASSLNLSTAQVVVKPNFVSDSGEADATGRQDFFLYVGRLSGEKGIDVLLNAVRKSPFPLKIIGSGPLENKVLQTAAAQSGIDYAGWQDRSAVTLAMKTCRALIVPSLCYEAALPLVVLEAFATGTPVICSDQGNLREVGEAPAAGHLFAPGNSDDLSRIIDQINRQPELRERYAMASRQRYEPYSKEASHQATLNLYETLIKGKKISNQAELS